MGNLMNVLSIVLVLLIFVIVILLFIYWYISYQNKMKDKKEEIAEGITKTKLAKEYTKESIFKFMQFDKIEDNMIIQDNGKRFLMVIECEGINYDLMSEMEKTSVEAGFVQFLNTLRYPIQIYTQTRTVNISESILNYKEKTDKIKREIEIKENQYTMMIKSRNYNENQAEILYREIMKLKNLYEYGLDIINNIEKTSQNKNVLNKKYYVIVPYYKSEMGTDLLDKEEEKSLIFSELYTRAQSLIRALFSCEIKCKILDSNELVELLYIAYNRDDSEIFGVNKAIQSGYNQLYSTAADVLDKKMRSLDKQIQERANELLKEAVAEARTEKEKMIREKEINMEKIIEEMAKDLVEKNQKYIGKEIADEAIKKIKNKKTKEGGKLDEQKRKTRRKLENAE